MGRPRIGRPFLLLRVPTGDPPFLLLCALCVSLCELCVRLAEGRAPYSRGMHFTLIDRILERTENSLTAIKQVSMAEEYLQDHFPGFEVLPGVMMIEALVQAGRELVGERAKARGWERVVLGSVRALKYGAFVRPGQTLRVTVTLLKETEEAFEVKGEGVVDRDGGEVTAVSGRLLLRAVRLAAS